MENSSSGDLDFGAKLQWLITTILGIIAFFYAIWVKYITDEIKYLKERQHALAKDSEIERKQADDSIWEVLESLRSKMGDLVHKNDLQILQIRLDEDRKLAAQDRANIAVMMATKAELERQLDKLYDRLMLKLDK